MDIIDSVDARKILDSRGEWTLEVAILLSSGEVVVASAPQGRSTGSNEAVYVDPGQAVENVRNEIAAALKDMNPVDQETLDQKILEMDGTDDKSALGANAILATSMAIAKAGAIANGVPLWEHFRKLGSFNKSSTPRLFVNMVNGGVHAGNDLDFQEYLVIPNPKDVEGAIDIVVSIYDRLGDYIKEELKVSSRAVGDEGGFVLGFEENDEPFEALEEVVSDLGFEDDVDFGLRAGANEIDRDLVLDVVYSRFVENYDLFYLEDPFPGDDFEEFAEFKNDHPSVLVAGDDLTVTNLEMMEETHKKNSINSMVVKPSQIGTVSETLKAISKARDWGWRVIVSHRSGETNDDAIADLAFGVGAFGFKLGAPARGERVAKYNRLLEIHKSLN